ncbi:unnamed protein product [Arctia plantaginis]|uniref:Uncharacterized protein n=1 Tax=Arctia plantaginis TaxID=874455 RepID=A0A8S1BAD7_ARCPL|nr:unnamed protein product [Arctia plantaginis]CAB3253850.1 unnamed protein product [Arctia plantaginis]
MTNVNNEVPPGAYITIQSIVVLSDDLRLAKVKPVGDNVANRFVPLTEIPPPHISNKGIASGRRHLPDECTQKPPPRDVFKGPQVDIIPEYYDDKVAKKVDTVVIPDHIDHKHFEVTTQVPYLTVGPIEAIGYHPSTMKSEHPSECEKIYQDHLDEQYSEESQDYSEESLEMARMPIFLQGDRDVAEELTLENLYEES